MAEPLLSARGLVKSFERGARLFGPAKERVRAVRGVDLDLRRGETLALVGESGCGKTTTARLLLGLLRPDAGEVRFEGSQVSELRGAALARFRGRVQIVFQDPFGSLNPRLSVGSTIAEVLRVHEGVEEGRRERAHRHGGGDGTSRSVEVGVLLERVGLRAEDARRYPHELSGGQRQRVGIARALATRPEVLVLDEPVSALDVSIRAQVVNLLADLQEELGLTYLLIAHDLRLVEHASDRIAVMYLGRIVETGPSIDVFASPRHPYTRVLLAADPAARSTTARAASGLPPVTGEPPSPAAEIRGCPFHPRCPHPAKDAACTVDRPRLVPDEAGRPVACIKENPAAAGSPPDGGTR